MAKIKVMHVITRLILGGAQENTVLTVEGLNRLDKYDVELVSGPAIGPEGELINRVRKNGITLTIINEMRRNINPLLDAITFVKLFLHFVREKPTIVHTHSSKAGILGRFAAKFAGVKVIVHTIHGLPFHPYQSAIANWVFIALEQVATAISTKVVTVGEVMKEKAIAALLGRADKFVVIYSGMEVEKFTSSAFSADEIRQRYGVKGKFVIGCISRLAPLKGHEYLLDAVATLKKRYPDVALLLVGDGTLRREIENRVGELSIKNDTIFTGMVESEKICELVKIMDVLVHTSLREGLPRAIPQALIAGKPVVAFDIDGAREVVIDGVTGHLVGTTEECARQVAHLLKNPSLAHEMGRAGREHVRRNFLITRLLRDEMELFSALASG